MTTLYRGCIAGSIASRAGALTEFQLKLQHYAENDALYKAELIAAAPGNWKEFFEEVGLVDCLFTHGRYIGKHKIGTCEFTSARKVRSMVNALLEAWPDLITLEARVRGGQVEFRFHVTFG